MDWLVRLGHFVVTTFTIWGESRASRMSAALSYYSMLSLAPGLVICVAIAGLLFGEQLAESQIVDQIANVTSVEVAQTVKNVIDNSSQPETGLTATVISLFILLFGASGVFSQLYDTMNIIWGVPLWERVGPVYWLQQRLRGIVMVLLVGLLLVTSLALSTILTILSAYLENQPDWLVGWLELINQSTSFLLLPVIFMAIFRYVPNTTVRWRDVWLGGIITAALFVLSRRLIGVYVTVSAVSSVYGAAGSLVVLLVWIYVTGMIVFLGASFCKAFAEHYGSRRHEYQRGRRLNWW